MKVASNISLRDIAEAVGVSVSTVSRALNDNDRVSKLTKQAVHQAVEDLAAGKQGVAGNRLTRPMIGVTHSHFYGADDALGLDTVLEPVLVGVETACFKTGFIPFVLQQSNLLSIDKTTPFYEAVSGVVMTGGLVASEVLDAIVERQLPIVIVGGHIPGANVPSVAADSQHGIYILVQHLIQLGHRRIAMVNGPKESYTSHEKLAGFLAALVDAQLPIDPALIRAQDGYSGFSVTVGQALTESLLRLPERPTAIVYAADNLAEGGYRAAQAHHLQIPGDLSITGFHDDRSARTANPPMTTVHTDRALWGELATNMLLHNLEGEPIRGTRLLTPVKLIIRGSTGPAVMPE